MLPTSSSSSRSPAGTNPTPEGSGPQRSEPEAPGLDAGDGDTPLGPIGPERLAKLREAIRNGTYPTESDVVGGLVRLFDERSK